MANKYFTKKEKREYYTKKAKGEIAPKKESKYSEAEQLAYARGQRDARNDIMVGEMLGKNSKLSDAEKKAFKERRKAQRAKYNEEKKNK